jgi:hypothetical protein
VAQRVYLIPVKPDVVELFVDWVLAGEQSEDGALRRLKQRAARHKRLNASSVRHAARLDLAAVEAVGRAGECAHMTALRPYCYAAASPRAGAEQVARLLSLRDPREIEQFFAAQVAPFPLLP